MNNDTTTMAATASSAGSNSTTTADALLEVYTVVEFSDFEYCHTGCWISLAVLSLVVSLVVLRPLLKRILPNFWSKELFLAVFFVLLEILSDCLEALYAVLGLSKFLNAPSGLTAYNRWWLALSSIGFGLGGLLELVGLGDAFCRRTVLDRVLGSGWVPCCWFAPSEEDEVRSRLERFPRLSDRMRWGWFRRGVWWETFFFYLCFGLLATVTPLLANGYLCWLVYPIFTTMVSCVLRRIDPNEGEGATAFLFPRTLEAVVITAPLLVIEVLASRSIGFLTGALLVRDALEILWTVVDFWQQPKEEPPSPQQQLAGAANLAGEKLQQLAMVPTQTMSIAMSTVSRKSSQDQQVGDPQSSAPQQQQDVETGMGKLHHLATLPTQTINTAMSTIRGTSSQERETESPPQQRQSYVGTARGKLHDLATLPTRTINTAMTTVSQNLPQQQKGQPPQPELQQQQQQGAAETARAKIHQ